MIEDAPRVLKGWNTMKVPSLVQTKFLILSLVIANALFGIIPLFAVPVLNAYEDSILMIVFIRFTFSSLFIFIIICLQVFLNKMRLKRKRAGNLEFFTTGWGDIKKYIASRNDGFFCMHRMLYLFILGFFGVTLNVVTYLIGLEELSIILFLIGTTGGIMIVFSVYSMAKGREKFTLFKGIYIFLMILSLILTISATQKTVSIKATGTGVVALVLNLVALFVLFEFMSRDNYSKKEVVWKKKRKGNYRFMRTLTKLCLFMLFGGMSIIPVALVSIVLPVPYLKGISFAFFNQLAIFWEIAFNPNMLTLIFLCTVITFLLLFIPATFWDVDENLSLAQWNSILYLVDPIIGSVVSAIFLEAVDNVLLGVTLIMLSLAILLRYVHEKDSKVLVILFIDVKFGKQREILKYLSKFDEIRKYYWTTGIADMMIKATFGSIKDFYAFIAKIGIKEEIKIKFDLISFITKTIN
ncbi:MAG: hypothetical protein ACFFCS_06625 [Candidatus Hodarchaeota archaeon]